MDNREGKKSHKTQNEHFLRRAEETMQWRDWSRIILLKSSNFLKWNGSDLIPLSPSPWEPGFLLSIMRSSETLLLSYYEKAIKFYEKC